MPARQTDEHLAYAGQQLPVHLLPVFLLGILLFSHQFLRALWVTEFSPLSIIYGANIFTLPAMYPFVLLNGKPETGRSHTAAKLLNKWCSARSHSWGQLLRNPCHPGPP